jgi:hypothetical protein
MRFWLRQLIVNDTFSTHKIQGREAMLSWFEHSCPDCFIMNQRMTSRKERSLFGLYGARVDSTFGDHEEAMNEDEVSDDDDSIDEDAIIN